MCSGGAFTELAKVGYFHCNWLTCHLFPYVPLVSDSMQAAVGIWGNQAKRKLKIHWFGFSGEHLCGLVSSILIIVDHPGVEAAPRIPTTHVPSMGGTQ